MWRVSSKTGHRIGCECGMLKKDNAGMRRIDRQNHETRIDIYFVSRIADNAGKKDEPRIDDPH